MSVVKSQFDTIAKVSEEIRTGAVSPVEIVKDCLDRIQSLNPELRAFITVNPLVLDQATGAEKEIKEGKYRGPLHGIPVALKDFFDTADMKTTAGFVHFKNRAPSKDAVVVSKLKEAGAIILGKTNMHQLGMGTTSLESFFGAVVNPWNGDYIAGGSSGGSAAAVAAGLCFATIDTDAVGSCRLPAACCGVVGFKGTYGLIPTQGILDGEKADDMILQLAHAAITTRDVRDTAIVLSAITETQILPDTQLKTRPRIGILKDYKASSQLDSIFKNAVDALKKFADVSESGAQVPLTQKPSYKAKDVAAARASIGDLLFKDFDVLISPTTTEETLTVKDATKRGPLALSPENTFFANYFGLPAISVPCGFSESGLPVGLQFVGPAGSEISVMDAAQKFLNETGWHLKHPPTLGGK